MLDAQTQNQSLKVLVSCHFTKSLIHATFAFNSKDIPPEFTFKTQNKINKG